MNWYSQTRIWNIKIKISNIIRAQNTKYVNKLFKIKKKVKYCGKLVAILTFNWNEKIVEKVYLH